MFYENWPCVIQTFCFQFWLLFPENYKFEVSQSVREFQNQARHFSQIDKVEKAPLLCCRRHVSGGLEGLARTGTVFTHTPAR